MNVKPKLEFFVNGKKAKHKVTGKEKNCPTKYSWPSDRFVYPFNG
jgi:hypothetical protein